MLTNFKMLILDYIQIGVFLARHILIKSKCMQDDAKCKYIS